MQSATTTKVVASLKWHLKDLPIEVNQVKEEKNYKNLKTMINRHGDGLDIGALPSNERIFAGLHTIYDWIVETSVIIFHLLNSIN